MSNENDPTDVTASGSGPRPRPSGDRATRPRYGEGDVIAGRYTLGRRLGEGGMGEVWLAHNQTLDIDVAVKLIRAGDEDSQERADRLLNEARAAAKLGHPAIVRVNDFGKNERGDPFIVMELLNGEDLAETLSRRGRLSAVRAVRTLLPIASALAVAHSKGIIHRDLKPENIFLAQGEDGQVQPKLVDFGVAKLELGQPTRLTQTGELMGSPLYMSPEQARGDDVDHRADVWSLGVVLYEIMAGRPPFEGKNYNAVLYSIIANPAVPIQEHGIDEPELWEILSRALAKDPHSRWYSMRDFGEALAHWLEERGIGDDITGSSLQVTWFNWVKDDGEFESAPPSTVQAGPASSPDIPPPPLLPTRHRDITVKTARQKVLSPLWVIGGISLIAGIGLAVLLAADEDPVIVEGQTSQEASPKQAGIQEQETSAEVVVTDEAAGEMTGVFVDEPAVAPSALPRAEEHAQPSATAAPRPRRRAPRPAARRAYRPAPRQPKPAAKQDDKGSVSSSGIVVKDPYQ